MHRDLKEITYDDDLQMEVYRFHGVVQAFPPHFHEYYVIGLIKAGERRLTVDNQEYRIGPGDLMTFNPGISHSCEQIDNGTLCYLCLNLKRQNMLDAVYEMFGYETFPRFRCPVQFRTGFASVFCELHSCIMDGGPILKKEELYFFLMQQLLSEYAAFDDQNTEVSVRKEIEVVCTYLEQHYTERITLDTLSRIANLNKYSLVRMFTRHKGITPYRYLETVRIGAAKRLLEQGIEPVDAALQTGFSDQSHFSGYFSRFIGLTPGQYKAIFRGETE